MALFLAFTLIPLAELILLIRLGGTIGFLPTVAICLLTGFAGASLARAQGLSVLRRIQEVSAQGQLPTRELLEGVMILLAGVVLITPGFLTDVFGLLLLTPPFRALMRAWLARRFEAQITARAATSAGAGSWTAHARTRTPDGEAGPVWQELSPDQELLPPGAVRRPDDGRERPVIDVEVD